MFSNELTFSEYTPAASGEPEKPTPPMYAGSYVEPSDKFGVCTLCGEVHVYHPNCPHCGKPHAPSSASLPEAGSVKITPPYST